MARTTLAVTAVTDSGVQEVAKTTGIADGHMFANDGRTWIEVTNSGSATRTLTIQTQKTFNGFALADRTVSITDGTTKKIGPFPTDIYNVQAGADAGKVYIDYQATFHADFATSVYRLE